MFELRAKIFPTHKTLCSPLPGRFHSILDIVWLSRRRAGSVGWRIPSWLLHYFYLQTSIPLFTALHKHRYFFLLEFRIRIDFQWIILWFLPFRRRKSRLRKIWIRFGPERLTFIFCNINWSFGSSFKKKFFFLNGLDFTNPPS